MVYRLPIYRQLAVGWFLAAGFFAFSALALTPALLVVAAVLCVLGVRSLRLGVVARDEDVVVRGTLWTWPVPWSDVERFEVGGWRLPGRPPCGVLLRRDAPQITILALNPADITDHPDLDEMLSELNALRPQRGSGRVP